MNAYLGLTALALAAWSARGAYRDRWVAFWVTPGGLGSVLMLGQVHVPVRLRACTRCPSWEARGFRFAFHLWVSAAVAALAAVGVDRQARRGTVPRPAQRGGAGLGGVLALGPLPILACTSTAPVLTGQGRWNRRLPERRASVPRLARERVDRGASARTLTVDSAGLGALVGGSDRSVAAFGRRSRSRRLAGGGDRRPHRRSHWRRRRRRSTPSYWTEPPAERPRGFKADPTVGRVSGVGGPDERTFGRVCRLRLRPIDFCPARDTLGWSLAPVWGLASEREARPRSIPRRVVRYADQPPSSAGWARHDVESVTHLASGPADPPVLDDPASGPPSALGAARIYRNPGALPRARRMGRPGLRQATRPTPSHPDRRLGGDPRPRGRRRPRPPPVDARLCRQGIGRRIDRGRRARARRGRPPTSSSPAYLIRARGLVRPRLVGHGGRPPRADPPGLDRLPGGLPAGGPTPGRIPLPSRRVPRTGSGTAA